MEIIKKLISELKPYAKNAKKHPPEQVNRIAESLGKFGWRKPLVVTSDGEIVCGHGTVLAAKKLGLTEAPCVLADDMTADEIRAFRLADNKAAESDWDFDILDAELKELFDADINMSDFGFDFKDDAADPDDEYTKKIKSPQYEITGEEVGISDLTSTEKYNELVAEINNSGLPEEQKSFLRLAAGRHIVFDYHKIAEYYAGADKDMQNLMEKSALVIIDFDDAIKNGYVKLSSTLDELIDDEISEEDDYE